MLVAERALIEFNSSPVPKCGLVITVQMEPLKCWISERRPVALCPTAQTFVGERTASLFTRPALAMATSAQVVPLKCRAVELVREAAQISLSESAERDPIAPMSRVVTNSNVTEVVLAALSLGNSCPWATRV